MSSLVEIMMIENCFLTVHGLADKPRVIFSLIT